MTLTDPQSTPDWATEVSNMGTCSQPAGRATAGGCHYQLPNAMMGHLVIKNQLSNIILMINVENGDCKMIIYYYVLLTVASLKLNQSLDPNLDLFCLSPIVFITYIGFNIQMNSPT